MRHPAAWAWETATGNRRPGWRRGGLYFHEFDGPRHFQLNIKRYWTRIRLHTWAPSVGSKPMHKRSIGFGIGYLSWRVGPSVDGGSSRHQDDLS